MRTIIKNGLVYDGSGAKPRRKQILIKGDKISKVSVEIPDDYADLVIDAEGMCVTPGFIDTHRHCDIDALYHPDFGKMEISQGLTTVVGGNCGLSPIPAPLEHRREIYDFIEPCLGIAPADMAFESVSDYLEALAKRSMPVHVGTYIGTGTLKAAIKGYGKTPFTKPEMDRARCYIRDGLGAGAVGLSMGIMYQPECYSTKEEMQELISAAAPFGKPLACHIRGEGDHLVSSVKEIIEIAGNAGVPLNISHFKITGVKNWGGKIKEAIGLIEEARGRGQDVTVDFYPYCGGSTTLLSLLPPTVMEESVEETLKQLTTRAGKEKLRKELYREHPGWDNMVMAIGWERILISSVTKKENQQFSGRTFLEASKMAGYVETSDFLCDLLVEEEGKVGIIVLSMSQEDVDLVAGLPYSMVISDALYGVSDCPHPRLYGSFPKIIREYVRERHVLTMEEAVRKMTALPAKRLSMKGRGKILEGYQADIAVFRADELRDYAVYENPKQLCTGFYKILVDGRVAVSQDQLVSRNNGRVLKI